MASSHRPDKDNHSKPAFRTTYSHPLLSRVGPSSPDDSQSSIYFSDSQQSSRFSQSTLSSRLSSDSPGSRYLSESVARYLGPASIPRYLKSTLSSRSFESPLSCYTHTTSSRHHTYNPTYRSLSVLPPRPQFVRINTHCPPCRFQLVLTNLAYFLKVRDLTDRSFSK